MTFLLADRVKETTITTGIGTVILAGAVTDYQSFIAVIGANNNTYYCITLEDGGEWEVGIGTVRQILGVNYLDRDTVLSSSNAGSKVSFSAGAKDVFVTHPAGRTLFVDADGIAKIGGSTNYTEILADGEIRLHGTARVAVDLEILLGNVNRSGPTPTEGQEDYFRTIDFDKNAVESIYFTAHTPSDYTPGTDVYLHLDFFVDSVDTVVQRAVVWGMEYKVIQHGQVVDFGTGTVTVRITHVILVTTVNKEIISCNCLAIAASDLPGEGTLLVRLFRDGRNVADTQNGDVRLFDMHFYYTADRIGEAT